MSVYVAAVMSVMKPLLWLGTSQVRVEGLPGLLELLKQKDRGVVTVSNHISVLDDPLAWAAMPYSSYFNTRTVRWTLGASDILFTNPLFATIFHNGQVIETFRGRGIYQPALSTAINKLDEGRWIHIFPEGKVNQPLEPPSSPTRDHDLLRFRWGVSRLIMEARREPWIVPMYLQGFDRLMPEDRPFPRFLPRLWPRKPVSITFGAPLRVDAQRVPELESYRSTLDRPSLGIPHLPGRFLPRPGHHPSDPGADTALARKCRIAVADWLREEVDRLGREVRGREGDGTRGGRREGFGGPGVETH